MTTPETDPATSLSYAARRRARRRHLQAGQSAIIAVIVLFLLLFLGAAFIALIANNLRGTQRAVTTSESGRFAEAGIRYLDQQLMTSPQGADWRPVPACPTTTTTAMAQGCTENATTSVVDVSSNDPDYYYLQPLKYDAGKGMLVGGYTRINFGGPTPTAANAGGRALVRVTYAPDVYDESGKYQSSTYANSATTYPQDPAHKYIKLEVVGRSGQIDPNDPTTFGNSNGIGQRVELVAYKQIGLNEFVRQVTNKDNRPDAFALGDVYPVQDYDANYPSTSSNNPDGLVSRDVETLIDGPIRVNGNLTFYGVNRIQLNPMRNDDLEVAGKITLNGVSDYLTTPSATDPTRVYINVPPSMTSGNLYPSDSTAFTTTYPDPTTMTATRGVVRDNPRGSETLELSNANATNPENGLRAVSHSQPPLIDTPIGPNGLTRYLVLTRDSPPIPSMDATANPLDASLTAAGTNGVSQAGADGWGYGIYVNNGVDQQSSGVTSSLRTEWLNPPTAGASGGNWTGDLKYQPPAVDIVLTPRYMVMTSSNGNHYFHAPAATMALKNGAATTSVPTTPGQILTQNRIVRYCVSSGVTGPPAKFIADGTPVFQGYPYGKTTSVADSSNGPNPNGDIVIYAEGNVSIHGTLSGYDAESGAKINPRHLTIVSNGTIYVNGNLLRDNLPASDADHNKSSIALLAKQYVTVNTTQFLTPDPANNFITPEGAPDTFPVSYDLNAQFGRNLFNYQINLGPEDRDNTVPKYVTNGASAANAQYPPLQLFFRHGAQASTTKATTAAIKLALNPIAPPPYYYAFNPTGYDPTTYVSLYDPTTLLLSNTLQSDPNSVATTGYNDDVFSLSTVTPNDVGQLIKINSAPGVGVDNLFQIQYQADGSISNADYLMTRFGVAPLDIRIEALIYAQEGSLFIIPGPSFNPDSDDTLLNYIGANNNTANQINQKGRRAGENPNLGNMQNVTHVSAYFPFYNQPMDARITFYGAISENVTAEIGDQAAWLARWGWVPNYMGSSGLASVARPSASYPAIPAAIKSAHGPYGYLQFPDPNNEPTNFTTGVTPDGKTGGSGIVYQFDDRSISPYAYSNTNPMPTPIRKDGYDNVLPLVPDLPVAPGLLYFGENTNVPQ